MSATTVTQGPSVHVPLDRSPLAQLGHWDFHPDVPVRRRCGIKRLVRKGNVSRIIWVPCKSRRCTLCIENIVAAKMETVLEETLYGKVISNVEWMALQKQLARRRKADQDGDYMRIPVSPTEVLIVSNAEIGYSIDALNVELAMREARPEWGNLTHSNGWKPVKAERPHARNTPTDESWEDFGIVTAAVEKVETRTGALGLTTYESKHGLSWICNDAQHWELVRAAECMSDADYWARLKIGWNYDLLADLDDPWRLDP